jgi:hypothetical protein
MLALSHLPRSDQEGVQKGRTDGNSMKSGFGTDSCTEPFFSSPVNVG